MEGPGARPSPEVLAESRTDHEHALKLKGFEEWTEKEGYLFSYFYWSVSLGKKKFGEAGITILAKVRPLEVKFGLGNGTLDEQARVISMLFTDFVLVSTYNPQGGFSEETLAMKTAWEVALGNYLRHLLTLPAWRDRRFIWAGDLNVNPHRDDWSEEVWTHLSGIPGLPPGVVLSSSSVANQCQS